MYDVILTDVRWFDPEHFVSVLSTGLILKLDSD